MEESVVDVISRAIAPACQSSARAAGRAVADRVTDTAAGLVALAGKLAGARHSTEPDVTRKHVVVCAADHGLTGSAQPDERISTIAVVRHMARGDAALNAVARTAGAAVTVVDCGVRGGGIDPAVVDMRMGDGTADIRRGPAMTREHAELAVRTGIALTLSLADSGLDCLALGQVASGGYPASAALLAALTDLPLDEVSPEHRADVRQALDANRAWRPEPPGPAAASGVPAPTASTAPTAPMAPDGRDALAALAALGGFEIAVLTGVVLAAASIRVPVVLDDHGTAVAAVVAARLAPAVTGYLVASHAGNTPVHRRALAELGQSALFDHGLARGEGTGSCLALPMIDSAARLLRAR